MNTDRPSGEAPAEPGPEAGPAAEEGAPAVAPSAAGGGRDGDTVADGRGSHDTEAGAEEAASGQAVDSGDGAGQAPGSPEKPAAAAGDGESEAKPRSAAAEALAAAVRAVESGERSASSFFAPQARPAAPPRPQGPSGSGGPGDPVAARPATVSAPATDQAPGVRPPLPAADRVAAGATVREVLAAGGAPETLAEAVVDVLGERAAEALREDPWQLLAVAGVRLEQADGFARALLGSACGPGDERRTQALIGRLLERAAREGHTAMEPSELAAALAENAVPNPQEALQDAIAAGVVLVFQDALDTAGVPRAAAATEEAEDEQERPVRVLLGLDRYALAEESLADGLARLHNTFVPPGDAPSPGEGEPEQAAPSPADWEGAEKAAVGPSAAELIRAAATAGLVVHTGGEAARREPAALVAAARALGLRAYAATHSEDGRRRSAEMVEAAHGDAHGPSDGEGAEALADAVVTLSGLLSGGEGPGRDPEGALALDVLVVLDAPQLDVETAAMLVESLPDGARLVLSGDPGVLWSAGPGRVFSDLLGSRVCPQVASRTPDPGPVGELVSGIGIGELNQVDAPGKEVVIVPVRDAGEAVHRTVQLVADSVPRAIGVPPEHTQVITPGHGGSAGTRALNVALKERLNPGPGRFGGFDPGDRVVHVPVPGRAEPGTVLSADERGLHLDCAGRAVVVPRERVADAVRHGWALTAHQAAGTRWPAAVVVLPGDAAKDLTRSWVYTAFSRGERHLSVVHGVDQALPHAVREVPVRERSTRLRTLLEAQTPPAG